MFSEKVESKSRSPIVMSKGPQSLRQRHGQIKHRRQLDGERGKQGHAHLVFPLCVEQLGSSVQTHRRIGLEHQCPIVQLERIIRVFEALVDLV